VDVTSVIMEGIYRIDEWSRYRRVIPSERTFFELTSGWTKCLSDSKEVRDVLYHVQKRLTAAEICYNMHTSLFHACALLYDLIEKSVIEVAGEAEPPPVEVPADLSGLKLPQTVAELLALARAEMKDSDFENALAVIHSVLDQEPKNAEAHRLREEAEKKYVEKVYENGLSPRKVPQLPSSFEHLAHERLGPKEGFVLSRINGEFDIGAILSICPFREAETLSIIKKMLDNGIIGIK